MFQQVIDKTKTHFDKTLEYLKGELMGLQVGRATPSLVEDLEVEAYSQKMPLKQLAAIQTPEPRVIIIRPWDKSIIKEIEKAIQKSQLNLAPIIDGDIIRLTIPQLTEERRKQLVKIVGEKVEECHINIRRHREDAWKEIQGLEKDGKISEDDKFKAKDKLQELVDKYNKEINEIFDRKEQEIMKI